MEIIYRIKFWWRTRSLTKQEKFLLLQQELRSSFSGLKNEFQDEPQTREMIDAFNSIEEVLNIKCGPGI